MIAQETIKYIRKSDNLLSTEADDYEKRIPYIVNCLSFTNIGEKMNGYMFDNWKWTK